MFGNFAMKARLLSEGTWICGKTNISKRLTGPQFSFIFTIQNNLSKEDKEMKKGYLLLDAAHWAASSLNP